MRITSILSLSLLYSRFFFVQSNNSFTEIRIIMFVVREYQIKRFNQWETRVGNNWPITGLETHPNWCVLNRHKSVIFSKSRNQWVRDIQEISFSNWIFQYCLLNGNAMFVHWLWLWHYMNEVYIDSILKNNN